MHVDGLCEVAVQEDSDDVHLIQPKIKMGDGRQYESDGGILDNRCISLIVIQTMILT